MKSTLLSNNKFNNCNLGDGDSDSNLYLFTPERLTAETTLYDVVPPPIIRIQEENQMINIAVNTDSIGKLTLPCLHEVMSVSGTRSKPEDDRRRYNLMPRITTKRRRLFGECHHGTYHLHTIGDDHALSLPSTATRSFQGEDCCKVWKFKETTKSQLLSISSHAMHNTMHRRKPTTKHCRSGSQLAEYALSGSHPDKSWSPCSRSAFERIHK